MARTFHVKSIEYKMKKTTTIILILFIGYALSPAQSGRRKIIEGNQQFAEEQYDEALTKYRDAQVHDPESSLLKFNIADAQYKKNKYEDALKDFQGSIVSDDITLQSQAWYNIGNTLYRSGKLPESILAYQEALKLNPEDEDAKYNLEFVRRQLKNQADKQQQQPQQQQQQQEQQQQEQQQQEQHQKEQQQEQQQSSQDQQDKEKQEQAEQQEQQQMDPAEQMSKQDAERILQAMKENEEDVKNARKQKVPGNMRVLKDW